MSISLKSTAKLHDLIQFKRMSIFYNELTLAFMTFIVAFMAVFFMGRAIVTATKKGTTFGEELQERLKDA